MDPVLAGALSVYNPILILCLILSGIICIICFRPLYQQIAQQLRGPSEPITSEPITSEPITSEPITSELIASEPITSEPIASEPITSELTLKIQSKTNLPPIQLNILVDCMSEIAYCLNVENIQEILKVMKAYSDIYDDPDSNFGEFIAEESLPYNELDDDELEEYEMIPKDDQRSNFDHLSG